jgi:ABC-type oligopeptide transport system ATPase subunit
MGTNLIGIVGSAGSGKDTVGRIIQYHLCSKGTLSLEEILEDYENHEWWLEDGSNWEIKKFAGKLKMIASILTGVPFEYFEKSEYKEKELPDEWKYRAPYVFTDKIKNDFKAVRFDEKNMTIRMFLQKLGTEGLRDGLHKNVWVNALFADFDEECNWIITDCRFLNEAEEIKRKGGILLKIDRPEKIFSDSTYQHQSETEMSKIVTDYQIVNEGSLQDLSDKVKEFLIKYEITAGVSR